MRFEKGGQDRRDLSQHGVTSRRHGRLMRRGHTVHLDAILEDLELFQQFSRSGQPASFIIPEGQPHGYDHKHPKDRVKRVRANKRLLKKIACTEEDKLNRQKFVALGLDPEYTGRSRTDGFDFDKPDREARLHANAARLSAFEAQQGTTADERARAEQLLKR